MLDWLSDPIIYNYIKALHVISIIAWMAGLLYLPRLFVYHTTAETGSAQSETFKTMERRLLRIIMNPAMIAAWVFGGIMLWVNPALWDHGWLHIKLVCVVLLTGLHHIFLMFYKQFERDQNEKSATFFKLCNEAPTVLMIIIVIMAVAEPIF